MAPPIVRMRKKQKRLRQFYVNSQETRDRPRMTREDVCLHLTTSHFDTLLHIPGPGASMTHLIALRAEPAPTPPQPSSPTPGALGKTRHLARNPPARQRAWHTENLQNLLVDEDIVLSPVNWFLSAFCPLYWETVSLSLPHILRSYFKVGGLGEGEMPVQRL